ncbi:molybdopterin-dependent oxidoreductase, partial [Mycolicibacterium vaccae]|nr:molybdopterin-dependent oxidoreductase [Mycolicibacterium vaccae]
MSIVNKGFRGRRTESALELPPGQHLTTDFPVLQTGPTPRINLDDWRFTIRDERGGVHAWTWTQLMSLPSEQVNVDIHCVTTWSKLDTEWEGVALDTLFESTDTTAEFALVGSYGGYTTNLPMRDLLGGRAWIVYAYDGAPLRPVHGVRRDCM